MNFILSLLTNVASRRVSALIHADLVAAIIKSNMALFHSVPLGNLYNVLMNDIRTIDESIADGLVSQIRRTVLSAMQLVVLTVVSPLLLVAFPFFFYFYAWVLDFLRAPSRDIKRFETASRGPLFTFFSDALKGEWLKTIREK